MVGYLVEYFVDLFSLVGIIGGIFFEGDGPEIFLEFGLEALFHDSDFSLIY